ncbi:DUF2164 domain-containing protein [Planctobacterium marinum]|uniref:DUF2164 domain-containing protein n=1 Tax=Planctobacterium marinum TaxID=1631968 RepID=A0AA48HR79_9ALTE|nr:hypothetical protein MACH26_20300 [Planctobacterium marinum]
MSDIQFNKEQKEVLVSKLQSWFERELDQELGQFDGEFLLDFISNEMGAYYYNRGLQDARVVLEERLQSIDEDLYAIEKEVR